MEKHRGIPSRLPGTDFQFLIRRATKAGPTMIVSRPRHADRRPADKRADAGFIAALWERFGEEPFERGNLDAGRISWFFGREIVAAENPFDPQSYDAMLRINRAVASASFPEIVP